MILRPYQRAAVDALYAYLRTQDGNPCIVIPTAGGKTPVIATVCRDTVTRWHGRVLVLAHVKELLEQTAAKLRVIAPQVAFGVYSAGLNRRDTDPPAIIAGIQSVYRRACELGPFNLIIVDEAHLIPPDGEGMYRQFLADAKVVNPNVRLIGLTATDYRLKSGRLCGPENLLTDVCYEIGVKELIVQGYLCPLITKAGVHRVDTSGLHVRAGEFIAAETEKLMNRDELVEAACREILTHTHDRESCLIFAAGVAHAKHIQAVLRKHGCGCGLLTSNTPPGERAELLARFRGENVPANLFGDSKTSLKYLVNVNVLSTGFDAPNIDCVALLRPTASPGRFYQWVGRGFRPHPGKANCLILDYGGNIVRHGPVDAIRVKDRNGNGGGDAPAKECPQCHSVIAAGYAKCPDCGYEFPPPERSKHEAEASKEGILSGQVIDLTYDVRDVQYHVHRKAGSDEDHPRTMRVDYDTGFHDYKIEWVCPEHTGQARQKFVAWWEKRSSDPIPSTAQQAVDIANAGGVAKATKITVRSVTGERFDRVVAWDLEPKPEPLPAHVAMACAVDDIPF
ncbi:MAG TPA: DEAD/DEAH box helicase family protein [Thermoguttaceae bacterium]|nr:DEAD/DEAH box helicase family protein [Thermoguttaceae bacterium]